MSGDLSKIAKSKNYSAEKALTIWKRLFNEHMQAHGLPEAYIEYLKKMVKASDLYSKAYNGQKWQIVKARVYEAEAKLLITGEGERIETTCARISKFMHFSVIASKCSVNEFYSYIALLKNN